MGSGTWAYTSGAELDEMEFIGTRGTLAFAVSVPTPFTVTDDDGTRSFDIGYPEWVHQPMVESIVAEIAEKGGARAPARRRRAQPGSLTRCCEAPGATDVTAVAGHAVCSTSARTRLTRA